MADCYYHGPSPSGPCPDCEKERREGLEQGTIEKSLEELQLAHALKYREKPKMDTERKIETVDELRAYMQFKLKDDSMFAEFYDVFLTGNGPKLFWMYEIQDEHGNKGVTIDYSVSGGGGWLNVGVPYDDFVKSIKVIALVWPMADSIKDYISQQLQALEEKRLSL